MLSKRGYSFETGSLLGWIIAILVLVLLLVLAGILFGKGGGAIEFIKSIFRFGK